MRTLSCGEARQIPIIEYLAKCGYQPQYIRGNNYWYLSPLHEESHASFKVNTRLNAWFDFGIGEGGNMIDLGIRLYKCSVKDFLPLLSSGYTHLSPDAKMIITFTPGPKSPAAKENHIEILDVTELQTPAMVAYIKKEVSVSHWQKHIVKKFVLPSQVRIITLSVLRTALAVTNCVMTGLKARPRQRISPYLRITTARKRFA